MKALLSLFVLVAACNKDNPYYCEGNPDNNCANGDGGMSGDGTTKCTTSDDCSGGTPACDEAAGVCVACTATDVGACDGTTPVCSTSNTCRACTENAECASGACMPDGSCANADTLVFASPSGGGTTCTASDKCDLGTAMTKVTATRNIIVLDPGTHQPYGTISFFGGEVTLLGRGATISHVGEPTDTMTIDLSGGKLTVLYATITGGYDTSGHGIRCTSATLTARFATFRDNVGNGVNATNCDVTIDSSTFTANTAGGISLSGASQPFTLTNNVLYLNGSATTATFGGVKYNFTGTPTGRFEFNTVVDNLAKAAAGNSGGVACGQTTVPITNSIVARNVYGTSATATDAQKWGDCPSMTSLVQNDITGLDFVNASSAPYNLKIGAASTAKDAATTASTVTVDFEGDARPQGGQKDIGADEYK